MTVPILCRIAELSFVAPVIAGAMLYSRIGFQGRSFFFYCLAICAGVLTEAIIPALGYSNHLFLQIFVIGQLMCTVAVFCIFVKRGTMRNAALLLLAAFILISVINLMVGTKDGMFNVVDIIAAGIIHLIIGGILIQVAIGIQAVPYRKNPYFWIGVSLLMYNAATIMLFSFGNMLYRMGMQYFDIAWHINWSLEIVSNFFFVYAFVLFRDE